MGIILMGLVTLGREQATW